MTASLFVRSILHLVIHRAIELVYSAASGFGSFFGGAAKKGPLRESGGTEGDGAPLINRRDAIRAAAAAAAELLPFDLPPSYFFSLACSAAGMKGNEPPLRIHFRKMDQPWRDARSIHRSLGNSGAREQRGTDGTQSKMIDGPAQGWLVAAGWLHPQWGR